MTSSSVIFSDEWLRSHGVAILVALGIAAALSIALTAMARRLGRRLTVGEDQSRRGLRRAATVTHSLTNAALALVWTIAILIIVGEFGVSLAPLIAGAGIAGVALGFGAQTLVRDGLSGFFILLEGQFDLGDTVEARTGAGNISGRVEGFTLRITSVRAFDGTLHYIPNGNIQVVSNRSRGWARAIVDVRVAFDEDPDRVREVLEHLFEELRGEERPKAALKSGPDVLGVETISGDALVFRVIADTHTPDRTYVERVLRERIVGSLTENGVKVTAGG